MVNASRLALGGRENDSFRLGRSIPLHSLAFISADTICGHNVDVKFDTVSNNTYLTINP